MSTEQLWNKKCVGNLRMYCRSGYFQIGSFHYKYSIMGYSIELADRVREWLSTVDNIEVEEKKMFSGLAFLVNGKMCINISHDNLMCRYNPELEDEVSAKKGFLPMIMRGKQLKDYCYVEPVGFQQPSDFEYWMKICLEYNSIAKASKKK